MARSPLYRGQSATEGVFFGAGPGASYRLRIGGIWALVPKIFLDGLDNIFGPTAGL
jgi:hypothetical protein